MTRSVVGPKAFLLLGAAAALWLLSPRMYSRGEPEWQPAGLGATEETARGWSIVAAARSVFGGGPAEAQDRSESRAEPPAQGVRRSAPRFSRITVEPGKVARFTGDGAPGTSISIMIDGTVAGTAQIGADGNWAMTVPALGVGDHRVALSAADAPSGQVQTGVGQELRIAIPEGARASEIVAFEEPDRKASTSTREAGVATDARVREHAERLAREASREFDDFSRRQKEDAERDRIAQKKMARDRVDTGNGGAESGKDSGPIATVSDWLSRSSRDYYDFVVPELARKGPRGQQMEARNMPPPVRPGDVPAGEEKKRPLPDLNTLVARGQDWLREANRTYNEVIVKDLSRRSQQTVAREEAGGTSEVAGSERRVAVEVRDAAVEEAARQERLRETLEREALDVAKEAVAEQQSAERRAAEHRAAEQRDFVTQRADGEAARLEEAERKRRLDDLLAARDAETARAERARQEEQRQAFERAIAEEELRATKARRAEQARKQDEARREEEARKLEEDRKHEELLAKLDADRRRAEEKRQRADAERQAERDRQVRAEAERVAREAAERERLAAVALRQKQDEDERRVARQEQESRGRQNARLAAVSERARRVGELADEAGFGKRRSPAVPVGTAAPGKSAASNDIPLPDRKSAADQRFGLAVEERRRREQRLKDQFERADAVAKLAQDAGVGVSRRQGVSADVPLPADPAVRREALRYASRLGGPQRRGSLKDDPDGSVGEGRGQRHTARRGGDAPIGGAGCKDRRAGLTIRLPGTYVVARGDTLWHISRRHYRRGLLYRRIYKANRRKIRNPHWIYPCQRFWLPQR